MKTMPAISCYAIKRGKPLHCPPCKQAKRATGAVSEHLGLVAKMTLMRVSLSRLEEGLGHEGFKCDNCKTLVRVVP